MNICVVGTGYVGLVTGAVFADLGNDVICVDNGRDKIDALRAGQMPIYEPGLEEMVVRNVADGRLAFTDRPGRARVRRSDIVFITVGTPPGDGRPDRPRRGGGRGAAPSAQAMERYLVVVNKSTVPVGTGEFVREVIERHQTRPVPFDVVSNPEFLREGSAIEDTLRPDRIVIGAPSQQVAMSLLELYAPLERPMIITDVPSAEMIKYASNAFLATKISFANAIANLCELAGADVTQVVKGMGLDARIGPAFLAAGLGLRRQRAFPKDTDSLVHTASTLGYDFALLRSVVDVNRERAAHFVAMIGKALSPLDGKVIGRARPGLQAQHRRHARGQEHRGGRRSCCGWAPPCAPTIRWPCDNARTVLPASRDVLRLALRGGRRRRRRRARHRVERVQVPQPRAAAARSCGGP